MKLNMEQRRIVELEPNGHMMVKGVAGSGKTTVAIRRISFLQNHYTPEDNDTILLVTYNKTLLQYIKYQYQKLADEEDEQLVGIFSRENEVKIINIDSIMYRYFSYYIRRMNLSLQPADKVLERKIMIKAIHKVQQQYPKSKILRPKNSDFLFDEVTWINACQIEDVETYQQMDRIGRATGGSGSPQKLTKNSDLRKAIFELMETFNEMLGKEGFVTYKQMNIMALREAQQINHGRYTHIIIDESQDLTRVQLEFLKCIYQEKAYSSILFVADNTQSIYSQSWLGKGRPYTSIGYDMSGKSRTLSKNYRTTTEISKAAYQLIENDSTINMNVDFVKPSLIDRHGHQPIYRFFTTSQEQLAFLVNEIQTIANDYRLAEICLVAKEKRLIESAAQGLEKEGIPCEILQSADANFESDKVKLVTMHSIKGLEFKVIFLIDLNDGVIPNDRLYDLDDENTMDSEERKLLYVGMTRANELLYMSSVKKPSKFIKEMNFEFLRIKRDCQLRPFHSIGIQDYQLTNQIMDLNSKEEVVRQWMIRELHQTYGYPLELLELEYPVQQFSRKGFVDIAVHIYANGDLLPYIFIEVKQFGSGIKDATEQLRSYLEAESRARYGIVTDGLQVIFMDRAGEILNDLPKCQPQFLPETKNKRTYNNLKNSKKYRIATEIDNDEVVEFTDLESGMFVNYETKCKIPLIGNVAAGIPITVSIEYDNFLTLPREWLISDIDTFALTVAGDSMIGAGIDKGDTVVVNRQQSASNGDIVIAIIDEEVTMKKFMPMGDSILLISENEKYEPIQMKKEDVLINGKVIGVMKSV
ncbi:transcriptional repressor LexA [Psychrobacillus sp. MER TA 171]|uniref:transcriptional repressor LexA n=1 Tax=Psychrobacillus sp. MER TA 171 TaxID=2939577 RepID=UPI002041EA6A|nr:transcriptional repressor LexA [Psychrobacillus sp. MER TA 171]MCM3359238.1 transcriptional repressor LexA [Psychrobacillus sp. MER TA 171]